VTQHDHLLTARRLRFRGREEAADDGTRVEERPVLAGDEADLRLMRRVASAEHHAGVKEGGGPGERGRTVAQVGVPLPREVVARSLLAVPGGEEVDAACRVRVAQERGRAKEQAVDDPEHRGVRSDPERERDDDGQREPRLLAQRAHGVSHILLHAVERIAESHLLLPSVCGGDERRMGALEWAEAAYGFGVCGVGRHALRDQLLDAQLDVERDLIVDLTDDLAAIRRCEPEQPADAGLDARGRLRRPGTVVTHGVRVVAARMRCITSA
jgi:hypothetical protein